MHGNFFVVRSSNNIQKTLTKHIRMHQCRTGGDLLQKCPLPNCRSSFRTESELKRHLLIHNNDLKQCQYCPFKYNCSAAYKIHLNRHFGIKDFKCDQCGKLFISNLHLNKHYAMHEGIIYHCLLCDGYKASSRNAMNNHLRRKHPKLVGKNINWDSVEKFVKIT